MSLGGREARQDTQIGPWAVKGVLGWSAQATVYHAEQAAPDGGVQRVRPAGAAAGQKAWRRGPARPQRALLAQAAVKIDVPGALTHGRDTPVRNEQKTLHKLHEAGVPHICKPLPHGSGSLDGRFYVALQLCGANMSKALLQASALTRTSSAVRNAGARPLPGCLVPSRQRAACCFQG